MNKREAKKKALELVIGITEQALNAGIHLDFTETDKDAWKLQAEIESIVNQLQIKREKFSD